MILLLFAVVFSCVCVFFFNFVTKGHSVSISYHYYQLPLEFSSLTLYSQFVDSGIYGDTYGGGLRYDGVAGDFPLASRPPTTTAGGGTYSSQSLSPKIKLDYFNDFYNNYYYVQNEGWVWGSMA